MLAAWRLRCSDGAAPPGQSRWCSAIIADLDNKETPMESLSFLSQLHALGCSNNKGGTYLDPSILFWTLRNERSMETMIKLCLITFLAFYLALLTYGKDFSEEPLDYYQYGPSYSSRIYPTKGHIWPKPHERSSSDFFVKILPKAFKFKVMWGWGCSIRH